MGRSRSRRRKHKRGISTPLTITMVVFLVIATSASISAFEWLRDFCLSRIYIKGVTIKGNQRISSENILDASRLRIGVDSVCSIMPHLVEKYVRTGSRYLGKVSVKQSVVREDEMGLCGWVTIEIVEREPIAIVQFGKGSDSYMVIDDQGFILEGVPSDSKPVCLASDENLPVIVGVDKKALDNKTQDNPGVRGSLTDPALELALDVLTTARSVIPDMLKEISIIDARDSDNIVVLLMTGHPKDRKGQEDPETEGVPVKSNESRTEDALRAIPEHNGVVIRLAKDLIREGLSNILPVITKRREENRITKYIDARFSGAVYCSEDTHYERRWKSG